MRARGNGIERKEAMPHKISYVETTQDSFALRTLFPTKDSRPPGRVNSV